LRWSGFSSAHFAPGTSAASPMCPAWEWSDTESQVEMRCPLFRLAPLGFCPITQHAAALVAFMF
jgi:hypothetical protein